MSANLAASPEVTVRIGGVRRRMRARRASTEERERTGRGFLQSGLATHLLSAQQRLTFPFVALGREFLVRFVDIDTRGE